MHPVSKYFAESANEMQMRGMKCIVGLLMMVDGYFGWNRYVSSL
jgi:hypothetical protein